MIKQAVITAGGFGTRLRPYTDTLPKPMIPLLGKPMLEWRLERFRQYGVDEFFFTLNYLPTVVTDYFGDGSRFGVKIKYFLEEKPMGTAGALKELDSKLDDLFFYGYGDVLAFLDYGKMQEIYAGKKDPIGMEHVQRSRDYGDADVAEIDGDGKYVVVNPKPHARVYQDPVYRMQGTFILDRKINGYISGGGPCNFGNELLPKVLAAGEKFYAYESDEEVVWVDTEEKRREVEEFLKKHTIK